MNLTNAIRDEIIKDVLAKEFAKEEARLKKQEHVIGMKCYDKVYPKKERDLAAALPKGWVHLDSCLRFNVAGMDMRFNINAPVPVKSENGYCARLGDIACDDIKQLALDLHHEKEQLGVNRTDLRNKLKNVLYAVNTYKRLTETWPEGKKYYDKYKPKGENSMLPAIRVAELNAALCLVKV